MNWPWKPNAMLVSNFSAATALLLDEVQIPIDFEVAPEQTFKLSIPMKIKDSAVFGEEQTAEFGFYGQKGRPFGQSIIIKFQVAQKIDEVALYTNAMKIFETLDEELNFDDIVEALKKTNNNEEQAKELLKKPTQVFQEQEDDLYD